MEHLQLSDTKQQYGNGIQLDTKILTAANSTYPKGGVSCFENRSEQIESCKLRIELCGNLPALRVAAKRQVVKKLPFSMFLG
jgi:hypothetical protein